MAVVWYLVVGSVNTKTVDSFWVFRDCSNHTAPGVQIWVDFRITLFLGHDFYFWNHSLEARVKTPREVDRTVVKEM